MIIWVAGSPGVGKSTVGRRLARSISFEFIDLPKLLTTEGLVESYDEVRDAWTVNPKEVSKLIPRRVRGDCVLSSHFVAPVKGAAVKCIVLRVNPLALTTRLKRRGYSSPKTAENVEAEFLGVVYSEAVSSLGRRRVFQLNTSGKKVEHIVDRCVKIVKGFDEGDRVDWLTQLPEDELEKLLSFIAKYRGRGL
ncbi:MAG: adenylate kinase family protein [Candidatus Caldarchaeum sp.]|nr:adenylate kinase family protein [Candidatus Caldarchaeum sp.]